MKAERLTNNPDVFRKSADYSTDKERLRQEAEVLRFLDESKYVPRLLKVSPTTLDMEYVDGQSLHEWIRLQDDWSATPVKDSGAMRRLMLYVELEQSLLDSGVLYRDMNLNHVLFTSDGVKIIDLEASSLRQTGDRVWRPKSLRGTWETMAPEEFVRQSSLTERTATYRVATVIHLVLAGKLPFRRAPDSKSVTYRLRRKYSAHISPELPYTVRRVLSASLQVEASRRHKDPQSLWLAIEKAYERGKG